MLLFMREEPVAALRTTDEALRHLDAARHPVARDDHRNGILAKRHAKPLRRKVGPETEVGAFAGVRDLLRGAQRLLVVLREGVPIDCGSIDAIWPVK